MTAPDVATVAKGLTKGGKRALLKIGKGWTPEGAPGPSRSDAYTLGWGKDAKYRLIDRRVVSYGPLGAVWAYCLTTDGAAVQAYLAPTDRGGPA